MAVPNRPSAGGVVESAWGQVVHDSIVAVDIQSGKVTINMTAAPSASVSVTFPRPFASAPVVIAMPLTGAGAQSPLVQGPSATAVVIGVAPNSGTGNLPVAALDVQWIAIGPRA